MSAIFIIILICIVFIARVTISMVIGRKMYTQTEQQLHEQMIFLQKSYSLHIVLGILGIMLLLYGIMREGNEASIKIISIVLGLIMIGGVIVGLFTRKRIIQMHREALAKPNPELYSLQKSIGISGFVLLIIADFIYKMYNLTYVQGLGIAIAAIALPLLYYLYKSRQYKNRNSTNI